MFTIFSQPPAPLTRRERLIFASTWILVAVSRVIARTRSAWDWDEYNFQLGLRHFDVPAHQPHPPGYPIFIAAGKFVRFFVDTDFHALQIVVLIGALFFFSAAFALARELRFGFRTALFGALIACFLPNVWYYGGTAFSDIPGVALGLFATALILRGGRDARAYVAGALLLGISAGIRPQNLLTALIPALIATFIRLRAGSWRSVAAGTLAGGIALGGCYAGAALASSSPGEYVKSVREQQQYVRNTDSYHNPNREPLAEVARRVFLKPTGAPRLFTILEILMLISLIDAIAKLRAGPLVTLISFLPFAVFTWLMLSFEVIPRYSLGYVTAYALLAADGIAAIARLLPQRAETIAQTAFSIVLAAYLGVWTWPAISTMRRTLSPVANGIRYIRLHAKPHQSTIFVSGGLSPHAIHDLADYKPVFFDRDEEIPDSGFRLPAYIFTPVIDVSEGGETFSLPHRKPLWDIVRRRNFEVRVVPAYRRVRFLGGWYGVETDGQTTWRWMGREGVMRLPPIAGRGRLTMRFHVPLDIEKQPPALDVRINGVQVEHSLCSTDTQERTWIVESKRDATNEVRLTISDAPIPVALHLSDDPRALGLELREYSWTPVP
jgi:hypothetical protein